MFRRALPHLIAAFVVLHVVASAIEVIPDVRQGLDRNAWKEPRVRHELERWAQRLGVARDDLEDFMFQVGASAHAARTALRTPFVPYLKATGLKQSWAMFVAGSRYRDRFEVRGRACAVTERCAWERLYFKNDDEHAFMKDTLESARVRSAVFRWGWPQGKHSYRRGCRAIAARAFEERPDLVAVQCRFEKSQAPDPKGREGEEPSFGRERVVPRSEVQK